MSQDNQEKKPIKETNKFIRFSQMGIVMGVIIGGFAWGGSWLNDKYPTDKNWWTVGMSLTGVIFAITYMIMDVIKASKKDDE